jgi:hypothetical protein
MIRNAVQHSENVCNSLVLNYKSAAPPTELCRRRKTSQSGAGCCPSRCVHVKLIFLAFCRLPAQLTRLALRKIW